MHEGSTVAARTTIACKLAENIRDRALEQVGAVGGVSRHPVRECRPWETSENLDAQLFNMNDEKYTDVTKWLQHVVIK